MQITSKFTIAIHILACIDYFHGKIPVNSGFLSQSIGANPVIVRGVMSSLNKAGVISAGKGRNDAELKKPLTEVTFYDVYQAVDETAEKGIFHFHENPSPACPVGRNIHKALDGELREVQEAMEEEMKKIPVSSVTEKIRKEIGLVQNGVDVNDAAGKNQISDTGASKGDAGVCRLQNSGGPGFEVGAVKRIV